LNELGHAISRPPEALSYRQLQWLSGAAQQRAPQRWQYWLHDQRSLTAQLRQLSGGQLTVELLNQRVGLPNSSEQRQLQLAPRQWAMVREVILCGGGQPWVFARTVVPLQTLSGPLRHLRQLGSRPLGEALFAQPTLLRSSFEIADCRRFTTSAGAHWGRRSRFTVLGRPLLVAEVFLDGFARAAGLQRAAL